MRRRPPARRRRSAVSPRPATGSALQDMREARRCAAAAAAAAPAARCRYSWTRLVAGAAVRGAPREAVQGRPARVVGGANPGVGGRLPSAAWTLAGPHVGASSTRRLLKSGAHLGGPHCSRVGAHSGAAGGVMGAGVAGWLMKERRRPAGVSSAGLRGRLRRRRNESGPRPPALRFRSRESRHSARDNRGPAEYAAVRPRRPERRACQ
jgi:hypothetical protein